MAEDERTVETSDDSDSERLTSQSQEEAVDHGRQEGSPAQTSPDSAADTFFKLDEALDQSATSGRNGLRDALVTDAERVDASAIPETYPLEPETEEAIELTVDFGTETATAYLAWPAGDGETALTRLLDAKGIELRDLYGERVLVAGRGEHVVLLTPDEPPRGSDRQLAIFGGLAVVGGFVGILALAPGAATAASPLWALVTFGVLPYLVYRDAWYLRTHSDWNGGPAFWATLSALPFLNLGTVGIYLWRRSRAQFFDEARSLFGSIAESVRSML